MPFITQKHFINGFSVFYFHVSNSYPLKSKVHISKKSSRRVILSVVRVPCEHSSYTVKWFTLLSACQLVKHCWEWGKKKSCKARVPLYTQLQGKTLNDKMLQKRRKKIPLKSQCHKNRDKFWSPTIIHWPSLHYMILRLGLGVWHLLWRLYFRNSILNS